MVGIKVTDLCSLLQAFLNKNRERFDECYSWKQPKHFPIPFVIVDADSKAKGTIRLRRCLAEAWKTADRAERRRLAEWYVKVWGGVKRNSSETINRYADSPTSDLIDADGFKGIASWSKVLAIRDPDNFVIYDARVAFALNAIQVREGGKLSTFFPIPKGRNSAILAAIKTLRAHSSFPNARELSHKEVYPTYLALLRQASEERPIEEAEMLLFALAEELALKMSHASS